MERIEMPQELPKFSSVEEELRYLRERVAQKDTQYWQEQSLQEKDNSIKEEVVRYAQSNPKEVLAEHLIIENPEFERVIGHLGSLPHREKVRELYRLLEEKGVLNSIAFARALNNPHIEDDFHRVLVGYIKTGALIPGLDKEKELNQALGMSLYEVTLPVPEEGHGLTTKDVIDSMDRFFVGLLPHEKNDLLSRPPFVFEIAMSNFSSDIIFYAAIPSGLNDLFLRQLFSVFPAAKVEEQAGDYNIFNENGISIAAVAHSTNNFAFPIQSLDEQKDDPLKVLLNAFHHIERDGEGVSVQFVVTPDGKNMLEKYKRAVGQIKQGASVKDAIDIPLTLGGEIFKGLKGIVKDQSKKEDKDKSMALQFNEKAIGMLEEKIDRPMVWVNVRIVVSAGSDARAQNIMSSLESSFNQFRRTQGNGLQFERKKKNDLVKLLSKYTFRMFEEKDAILLNTRELASMFHFPSAIESHEAPQLKALKSQSAPAPVELPKEGILLGVSKHRGEAHEIRFPKTDRVRHLYVIGQTGTGKSVFLKNLAIQDIQAGGGVCFIDPHGNDVQDILANVPKERIDDVIYFDPAETARPFGLNMLEFDHSKPEQKIFVVNEMLSIFKKLYSSTPESMGPAFEQYFRNATMLVLEDPETGCTLLEISRVLADKNFRNLKLSRCKNPIVVQFWREIAEKTSGEAGLANMIPYITNKFDVFLSNDVMRPIIAQEKSSFNFRDIMDNKKILLVNLSKGRLGDINANLIGLILVGKILMAALSRVDSYGVKLPDFYLYIDEFQNITTDSISAILSEARKYGLSLNVAHQFIAQLDESIRDAVFGNVGSMAVFRIGADDAKAMESQFAPVFTPEDIMRIDNYNCYMRMLMNGKPVPPFNIATLPAPEGTPEIVPQLKQLSALKYGRDRKTVDDAIMAKYLSASAANTAVKPVGGGLQSSAPVQSAAVTGWTRPIVPSIRATTNQVSPIPVQQPNMPFAQAFAQHAKNQDVVGIESSTDSKTNTITSKSDNDAIDDIVARAQIEAK